MISFYELIEMLNHAETVDRILKIKELAENALTSVPDAIEFGRMFERKWNSLI